VALSEQKLDSLVDLSRFPPAPPAGFGQVASDLSPALPKSSPALPVSHGASPLSNAPHSLTAAAVGVDHAKAVPASVPASAPNSMPVDVSVSYTYAQGTATLPTSRPANLHSSSSAVPATAQTSSAPMDVDAAAADTGSAERRAIAESRTHSNGTAALTLSAEDQSLLDEDAAPDADADGDSAWAF